MGRPRRPGSAGSRVRRRFRSLVAARHATRHLAVGTPPFWITDWSPPAFVAAHAHELIVALSLPLAAIVVRRHGWTPRLETCVPMLALLFLLRCVLDPQDLLYYHLPLIVALAAWEGYARRGAPWLTLSSLLLLYVVFDQLSPADTHSWPGFWGYIAVTLPLGAYLLAQLFGRRVGRPAVIASRSAATAHLTRNPRTRGIRPLNAGTSG